MFAALNILAPLYALALEKMQDFVGAEKNQKKLNDFRDIISEIQKHPNQNYFVLKRIIMNNLYGVDIMKEAVEICKLRLFLKLAAQLTTSDQIEPLPDVDFNIKAGNTLIGYVTAEEIDVGTGSLGLKTEGEVEEILEKAEQADMAYKRFQSFQVSERQNDDTLADTKQELRKRLDDLRRSLDGYLAPSYKVNPDQIDEFSQWRENHQPFHWLSEFYGIISKGGFDAIIGNPPYVECLAKQIFGTNIYATAKCGDLYAYVMERSYQLISQTGIFGMIVPISIFCTSRFTSLLELTQNKFDTIWCSFFANRPAQLFSGAQKRLSIVIGNKNKTAIEHSMATIFTSSYLRWVKDERPHLLNTRMVYSLRPQFKSVIPGRLEKIGSEVQWNIFKKLAQTTSSVAKQVVEKGSPVYYPRKFSYFLSFLNSVPVVNDIASGSLRNPSELKDISFKDDSHSKVAIALLSSSLFFWYWNAISDCRHLNKRDILAFPFEFSKLDAIRDALSDAHDHFYNALKSNASFMVKSGLRIETFDYKKCKSELDRIDSLLNIAVGLDAEELDFIINYDIKYRMGGADAD